MDDFFAFFSTLLLGFMLGANGVDNMNQTPIEHKLEKYCTDIGAELRSYDHDDELVCTNGAKFEYKLEDNL